MIVNVVVTKIIAAYIFRRIQSQPRWMERDSGEAKQSNIYQKKYSNFKHLSGLILCQSIVQYSQSIKHRSDFNWFRFSEVYKFVEDNVRGETIRIDAVENPYKRGETIRPKTIKAFSPNTFFSYTSKFPTKLLNMHFFYQTNLY